MLANLEKHVATLHFHRLVLAPDFFDLVGQGTSLHILDLLTLFETLFEILEHLVQVVWLLNRSQALLSLFGISRPIKRRLLHQVHGSLILFLLLIFLRRRLRRNIRQPDRQAIHLLGHCAIRLSNRQLRVLTPQKVLVLSLLIVDDLIIFEACRIVLLHQLGLSSIINFAQFHLILFDILLRISAIEESDEIVVVEK